MSTNVKADPKAVAARRGTYDAAAARVQAQQKRKQQEAANQWRKQQGLESQKGYTVVELLLVLVVLALIIGVGSVVIHFISKFW